MARALEREETGLLRRGGERLFLDNGTGHVWRLDVADDRVRGLIGLRVRVKGPAERGAIRVESIVQA